MKTTSRSVVDGAGLSWGKSADMTPMIFFLPLARDAGSGGNAMPSRKIVRTRKAGWCDSEFAHPGSINVGDRILVTIYFPRDEQVRDFGALSLKRYRQCSWCLERTEMVEGDRL